MPSILSLSSHSSVFQIAGASHRFRVLWFFCFSIKMFIFHLLLPLDDPYKTSADSGDRNFCYGFFLYCIVTESMESDVSKVDLRGKIYVAIDQPCPPHSVNKECRFRSKAVSMEFATSSAFAIRNLENQYIEWGRVCWCWAIIHPVTSPPVSGHFQPCLHLFSGLRILCNFSLSPLHNIPRFRFPPFSPSD